MANGNCCCNGAGGMVNDVCTNPICGQPQYLSVYAPVIYDQIGINICRPITVPADIITANPTVNCVQLEVESITFTAGTETVPGTTISYLKGNCVTITLTNVSVTYRVKLFDSCMNFLASTTVTANYLPANAASTDFGFEDDETNPTSVVVEMYAPYGIAAATAGGTGTINVVALITGSNQGVINGINASAVAKAMNFNPTTGTVSAGISLILTTVYYEAYKLEHQGKPIVPKASNNGDANNVCLEFVEGGLLSREIKPLELEPPKCEQCLINPNESTCDANGCFAYVCNPCNCNGNSPCPANNATGTNQSGMMAGNGCCECQNQSNGSCGCTQGQNQSNGNCGCTQGQNNN